MATELIVIDETKQLEYFGVDGAQKALNAVKEHLKDFVPDVTTGKGRDAIRSNAAKIGKSRKLLDDMGKDIRKSIQDNKSRRDEIFTAYQTEFRKPLTDWEVEDTKKKAIEAERVAAIQVLLDELKQCACTVDGSGELLDLDVLTLLWMNLDETDIDKHTYQEFESQAEEIKATGLEILDNAIGRRKKLDDDQAELARLREKEENEQHELDVLADIIDANEHTEEESTGPEAETMELNPPQSAAVTTLSISPELPETHDKSGFTELSFTEVGGVSEPKISDREHRRAINKEILKAIIACGFTEDQGKNLVASMVAGNIPHVTVEY